MGSLSKPFHSVSFGDEEVCCVSFSPYEWSKNFLAIGTENKVAIANVQIENVWYFQFRKIVHKFVTIFLFEILQDELEFNIVREFHHLCPVACISWSPLSSINTVPKVCKFATAGVDGKIRIYNSDLANTENIIVC